MFADKRYILIDHGYLQMRAIFGCNSSKNPYRGHPPYLALVQLISYLKHVGITEVDEVIIAVDSKGNWRKEIDPSYKSNRGSLRDSRPDINWQEQFNNFNKLLEQLDQSTPFHVVCCDRLEADDIIAVAAKTFSPTNEVIIISADTDYEQLTAYPNVKLFSNISKKFKEKLGNPYELLSKKINKERTDGLVNEVVTELDFEKRNMLVNLINLPRMIELQVLEKISFLPAKNWDFNLLPFRKLHERFAKIYDQEKPKTTKKVSKKRVLVQNVL